MRTQFIELLCLFALGTGAAEADNFEVSSGKKGCESVIKERERSDCQALSRKKNETCNVSASCDLVKQKRQIDEYNAAKDKLKTINDSDRSRLEQTIRELKDALDVRKSAAPDVEKIAQSCIDMRATIQDWFKNTAIPLTERARDEAMRARRDLVDKLKAAVERREKAKEKRDANPNDSSAKDDHERAASAHRDVEKELEAHNDRYGRDIERHAGRLVDPHRVQAGSLG
jgi:hypothetical protein